MRKLVLFSFFVFCYVLFLPSVSAAICDKSDVERLKKIAENVKVDYEYISDEEVVDSYYVSFSGLTNELLVYANGKTYTYNDTDNGDLTFHTASGDYQYEINSVNCADTLLAKKYVSLPKYNNYANTSECKKLEKYDLDICDEWYQGRFTSEYFYNTVDYYLDMESKNKETFLDKVIEFLQEYYVLIIIGSVALIVIIVLVINYRKRSVLE